MTTTLDLIYTPDVTEDRGGLYWHFYPNEYDYIMFSYRSGFMRSYGGIYTVTPNYEELPLSSVWGF